MQIHFLVEFVQQLLAGKSIEPLRKVKAIAILNRTALIMMPGNLVAQLLLRLQPHTLDMQRLLAPGERVTAHAAIPSNLVHNNLFGVQPMQDVAIDANAILGLVQNILPTYHGSPPSPLSGPKR